MMQIDVLKITMILMKIAKANISCIFMFSDFSNGTNLSPKQVFQTDSAHFSNLMHFTNCWDVEKTSYRKLTVSQNIGTGEWLNSK